MAKLRVALAISLDGYIATPDGGVDWLNPYFSPEIDFMAFLGGIGITVLGRTTYDRAVAAGHVDPNSDVESRSVVLTHRPIDKLPRGAETYDGDLAALAKRLRAELEGTDKDVWLMGGTSSIRGFDAAGLVDRWELSIMPIRLGAGIPLFDSGTRATPLRLVHHRVLSNGVVEVWYERSLP